MSPQRSPQPHPAGPGVRCRRLWRSCSALKVTPQGRRRRQLSHVQVVSLPAQGTDKARCHQEAPARPSLLPTGAPRARAAERGAGTGALSALIIPQPRYTWARRSVTSPPERGGRPREAPGTGEGRCAASPGGPALLRGAGTAGSGRGGNIGNGRARVRTGAHTGVRVRAHVPAAIAGQGTRAPAAARTHLPDPAGRSSGEQWAARTPPSPRRPCRSPPPPPWRSRRRRAPTAPRPPRDPPAERSADPHWRQRGQGGARGVYEGALRGERGCSVPRALRRALPGTPTSSQPPPPLCPVGPAPPGWAHPSAPSGAALPAEGFRSLHAARPPRCLPWPAGRPRTVMATGRNSSGTRRRRSCWAAPGAAGVSAGPGGAVAAGTAARPRRSASAGCGGAAAGAGGGLATGRPRGMREAGTGSLSPLPSVSAGAPRGPASAAPRVRLQVGPGVRRGRADLVEGTSSLGLLPFPMADPAREHRRRRTLTSQLSPALDFTEAFSFFCFLWINETKRVLLRWERAIDF